MITCGHCHGKHKTVSAVKTCHDTRDCIWQIPAAPGYLVSTYPECCVLSMDENESLNAMLDAESRGEIWAENAWLRHAEGWYRLPDRDEELAAMADATGLPVPPGFY